MNPPSAIHSAMNRERKPFTYTPGGLDLSEIKSERMAKRLMRNAMNQGVPELPSQPIQSPTTLSTPMAVPNYNCMPVQVFPAFNLPANPKSLLRTRSTPDQHRDQLQRVPPQVQTTSNLKPSGPEQLYETNNNNNPPHLQVNNNNYDKNRPPSLYEYATVPRNTRNATRINYGSDAFTAPILPEISYDAEFCHISQNNNQNKINVDLVAPVTKDYDRESSIKDSLETVLSDFTIRPLTEIISVPAPVTKPVEDNAGTDDDEQKEVKIVKKQIKKEKKVESQNGDQNGDTNAEAEMTVKLPTKKSAAKTETKVEVSKKVLPDGSVEEIKTTTTKTTIDGRTEIKTQTETTIIPKEEDDVEEVEEEEEEENGEVVVQETEENGEEEVIEEPKKVVVKKTVQEAPSAKESSKVVKKEERSETTTTKKVLVVQKSAKEEQDAEEEEEEEIEEAEPVIIKKPAVKPVAKPPPPPKEESREEEEEEEEEEIVEEKKEVEIEELKVEKTEVKKQEVEEEEQEEEEEEEEEVEVKNPEIKKVEPKAAEEEVEEEEEYEEAEEPEQKPEPKVEKQPDAVKESEVKKEEDEESEYTEEEVEPEKPEAPVKEEKVTPKEEPTKEQPKQDEKKEEKQEQPGLPPDQKVPLREPSIPLDKVEDVEIKPIGLSKTHTESTEIKTNTSEKPPGTLSTQTEYNRIENIVTVNRTTKTLDHSYEQLTQQGIPTVKTYFAPERERVSTSPQPAKPYQPVYPPQTQPERRHSLLLERLSTERQLPSADIYQNNYQVNNQSYEQQRQWSQEPQSEVINVSNVKPSMITNQQWYQQNRKENVIFNNVLPTTPTPQNQQWSQPQPQLQPQPQPQYQPSYTDNISNNYQQNSYPSYAPKPSNWASNNQSNQYSFINKDSSETYQQSTQQYSSSYVPPPWEQDASYIAPELPTQNYYQELPSSNSYSPSTKPGWQPAPPPGRFSKPTPTAYVPPAPNQSFVKTANAGMEPPKLPGRKTYYSEYERRYITVPESTYIPSETKPVFQPQPDPSPQYYYDNNEPNEAVEHQWRKELREFTEKTSQTQQQTEQTSVNPPWEEDSKYAKVPTVTYTPTPSWSQTLRPQSYRERSFESEYVGSKEWSKTNTLGRGRPLSSYGNSNVETIPERPRGVSVDRYNPNNYQGPITSEHGPVQTHTLIPPASPQTKGYHNPNVPAYHARASAEPREHPVPIPQARNWGESRTTPLQSRSFKYLQWITGTED